MTMSHSPTPWRFGRPIYSLKPDGSGRTFQGWAEHDAYLSSVPAKHLWIALGCCLADVPGISGRWAGFK